MQKGYNWKIGLRKFGLDLIYIVGAGLAAYAGDNVLFLGLAPLAKAGVNYLKHFKVD